MEYNMFEYKKNTLYAKSIYADPEKYFTDDVMKKLDDAAEKEFMYGNIHETDGFCEGVSENDSE